VAKDLSGSVNKLTVEGQTTSMEEPLFEVKNKDGKTVFAVYNEGVRIYVDDGDAKGVKGGFAIGGLDPAKGARDLFIVNADSIRAYINDLPGKAVKGGFAIGGFDEAKGTLDNYLKVDVEKINAGKVEYLDITPYNLFIGEYAGINTEVTFGAVPSLNKGVDNVFIGNQSGYQNTIGLDNVFIGYQSGMNNVEGVSNVFIGNQAGATNTGIGDYIGDYNVFIGYLTGFYNTDGQSNVFVGKQAGFRNTTGRYNTFLGQNTGVQTTQGNFNTYLGAHAAESKTGGDYNTMVGYSAGSSNLSGSGNIFIGRQAGSAETGSNLLYIENSSSASPLIGGDFTANMVAINGKPDPASASFQVNGSARLGNYGTTINNIIKLTISADIDPVASNSSLLKTFAVPHATAEASVMISPQNALPDGMVISYVRVSTTGTVEVKYRNTSAATIDLASMNWYITVIQ
jgi:trimeric autotransporter adhesin